MLEAESVEVELIEIATAFESSHVERIDKEESTIFSGEKVVVEFSLTNFGTECFFFDSLGSVVVAEV